jgi:ketosteroid isomerase-like protein
MEKLFLEKEQQIVDAFNSGDIEKILSFFDKDVIVFSSTAHERLGGLDELKKTFEYYINQSAKMECSFSSPVIQITENTTVVTFYWLVTLINESNRQEIHGRGSHVYIKKGDDWKIIHEHFSRAHNA